MLPTMALDGRLAIFVAAEIILLVTPMMWPTIPVAVGFAAYAIAALLAAYALLAAVIDLRLRQGQRLVIGWPFFDLNEAAARKSRPETDSRDSQARLCEFRTYEWDRVTLDPGEDHGGPQRYFRLSLPIRFLHNAENATIRVNAWRPAAQFDKGPPLYSWKPSNKTSYVAGDIVDVVFATVAENRQHNGFYGDMRIGAFYIGRISKHIFDIEVFSGKCHERTQIYLESPPTETYSNPPDGLGKLPGIIVLQEGESVFRSEWYLEGRAIAEGRGRVPVGTADVDGGRSFGSTPFGV